MVAVVVQADTTPISIHIKVLLVALVVALVDQIPPDISVEFPLKDREVVLLDMETPEEQTLVVLHFDQQVEVEVQEPLELLHKLVRQQHLALAVQGEHRQSSLELLQVAVAVDYPVTAELRLELVAAVVEQPDLVAL